MQQSIQKSSKTLTSIRPQLNKTVWQGMIPIQGVSLIQTKFTFKSNSVKRLLVEWVPNRRMPIFPLETQKWGKTRRDGHLDLRALPLSRFHLLPAHPATLTVAFSFKLLLIQLQQQHQTHILQLPLLKVREYPKYRNVEKRLFFKVCCNLDYSRENSLLQSLYKLYFCDLYRVYHY